MKKISNLGRLPPYARAAAFSAVAGIILLIAGCATNKDRYTAGEDAQQRQAFEVANETKASANIDTQATYLKVVDQMQQQGLWFASLAHIEALEQRWGVTPDSTRARADALRHTDQAELAETAYKRLLATPQESAGYRGLGLLAGIRGDYVEAAQLLKQAQRRTPTDALLLSDLGYASLRAGQFDEARLPLMQALQLQPDSKQAQANVALFLEVTNQREQAIVMMNAHRMPEATRAAVREAALQVQQRTATPTALALPAPITAAAPASTPTSAIASMDMSAVLHEDIVSAPLALKRSRWTAAGDAHTASQLNPSASAAETPLFLNSTSRGTP